MIIELTNDAPRMTLDEMRSEVLRLEAEAKAIIDGAEGEADLTEDELEHVETLYSDIDALNRRISVAERAKPRGRRAPDGGRSTRRIAADPAPAVTVPASPINEAERRTHGFNSFGEFARIVGRAYRDTDSSSIERLTNAATTYGTESVGGDGGWLVPSEFSDAIWQKVSGDGSLLSLCAPFTTSRNSLTFPKDETTPWDNSGGITVYWEGEGQAGTEAKPKFEMATARLNKLMALVKVTEELLEDASGLDSYLRFWTPVKMQSRINTAIVRGNGVGKPLGILTAGSLITVSKETSQDAATIIMPNVEKMWNRLYAPLRQNAVWLINQEVEPMLNGMAFVPSATAPGAALNAMTAWGPVYLPSGSVADTPYGRLKGRPVMPMNPCSALGTIGDIILVDLMQYMALRKAQNSGVRVDTSIHLHFDQAIDTYRFVFRVTGQPMWNSTISPENGSNDYGWAVALETRS
jgi:HK97 family phage major capsid protein